MNYVSLFNNHFSEFVDDIQSIFPEDPDILTAKNGFIAIRKANPKLLVKIWISHIYQPYQSQINAGDIQFFVNKDYSSDVSHHDNADHIIQSINRLRKPIKDMSPDNQAKTMKYIQNLSKLALLV